MDNAKHSSLWAEERGAVSVEYALTVPAVLIVLGIVLTALFMGAMRITLATAAGEISRAEARGETPAILQHLPAGTQVDRDQPDGLRCVTLSASITKFLGPLHTAARSCAVPVDLTE